MKKIFIMTVLMTLLAGTAQAETIKATVNGMVCAFCAAGIEKTFKARPEVESISVDLDNRLVTVATKTGRTLDDAAIKKIITDAGYSVTQITRQQK